MDVGVSLREIAGLIGDAGRSEMLLALLAGQPLTAGELSMLARVSEQNASGHLESSCAPDSSMSRFKDAIATIACQRRKWLTSWNPWLP